MAAPKKTWTDVNPRPSDAMSDFQLRDVRRFEEQKALNKKNINLLIVQSY